MSFLHALLSLPREGLIITGSVLVGLIVVVWLLTLFGSRHRYIIIRKSEETELLAFHIRRMADALERLAATHETQPLAGAGAHKTESVPTFGR